jgi:hypothetical protein
VNEDPLLTIESVRAWVGDFEIGKGRPYAEDAVFGCHWEADRGDLIAFVRGTRVRPYKVHVHVGCRWNGSARGTVQNALCSCPVGEEGKCKHVAAVLLAYVNDPARFTETMLPEEELEWRSKDELLQLLVQMLSFAPELKPLLAVPMPGFVRGDVLRDVFRALAVDALQGVRLREDRSEWEIDEALWPLITLGTAYRTPADQDAREALTDGVIQALRDSGVDLVRFAEFLKTRSLWNAIRERLERDLPPRGEAPPF